MRLILLTKDPEIVKATEGAFQPDDELLVFQEWERALEGCAGADILFVDLIATLREPHRIRGYEEFAQAKMSHPEASATPLVLIAQPADYELDFIAGWPNFVFAHVQRPVTWKTFRRATTWI